MIFTIALIGIIGIAYPVYILATYKETNSRIKRDSRFRLVDYKETILIFWGLTVLILINHFTVNFPALNFSPNTSLISIILFALVLIFVLLQSRYPKITEEFVGDIKEKMADIYHYLPKTKREFNWYILLSISAGICEEIIFRLFLFEIFKHYMGLIMAFLLANVLFAVMHMGSGKRNMLSSFILGLIFSTIYYFTNNIWIAVFLHIAIDINAGILGYKISKFEKTKIQTETEN